MDNFDYLNEIYTPLWEKSMKIRDEAVSRGVAAKVGFYNNHTVRRDGEFAVENFPIPVISMEGIGEIGIDLGCLWVELQFSREHAISLDYVKMSEHLNFDVYGAEEFSFDFYNAGMDPADVAEKILAGNEATICVCIYLPREIPPWDVFDLLKKIPNEYLRAI